MEECHYVDHESTENKEALAAASEDLKKSGLLPGNPRLLLTCHRIEHYGTPTNKDILTLLESYGLTFERIQELESIIERLTKIAVGTKSEIKGEWAIMQQIQKFVSALPEGSPTRDMGDEAVQLASQVRKEFGISAPDHASLLLDKICREALSKILIVVGSGMLGRKLAAAHKELGYEEVRVITRDPRSARKRMPTISNPKIIRLSKLQIPDDTLFDVVVASDGMDENYATEIKKIIDTGNCIRAIDVSSRPVLTGDSVLTLYSPRLRAFLTSHNALVEASIAAANQAIEDKIPQIADRLRHKWRH